MLCSEIRFSTRPMRSSREPARSASPTSARVDAGHLGDGGIGLRRVVDLELDQQAAQVALVARQRAVQQQRALGLVQLQQAGQRVDVLLDQRGLLLQRVRQPVAGDGQHRQQVLGLVLGVFVEVEEQRAFFVGAAPDAVALQELASSASCSWPRQNSLSLQRRPRNSRSRASAGAGHTRWRPASDSRPFEVAPHVELARPAWRASVSTKCEHIRSSTGASFRPGEGSTCRSSRTLDHRKASRTLDAPAYDNASRCYMEDAALRGMPRHCRGICARTMPRMIELADIRAAAARLQGQVLDTPCVESRTLSRDHRRAGVPEVREPAVHRLVQGARRLQQAGPAQRRGDARAA